VIGTTGYARDITERKRAEALSLKDKQFSDSIINSLPGIFYVFDSKGRFMRINARFAKVTGYSPQQVSKMSPVDFFSQEEKKKVKDRIREVFEKGESSVEADILSKDGKKRPYYLTGLRAIIGNVPLLVGMGIDITERRRVEEEIRLSRQRMALHRHKTPFAVIEWDENFKVREWNPAAERTFGYSCKEALGKYYDFIVPKSAKPQVDVVGKKLIAQRGGVHSSNENITKSGKVIICEWFNTTLVDAAGKTMGVASLVHDVTERQRAEEALREHRHQLVQVIDAVPHMIFAKDRRGRFLLVNRALAQAYGRSPGTSSGCGGRTFIKSAKR